jgi:ATP-dependent Clp protease ATP-binding subunit ClpC
MYPFERFTDEAKRALTVAQEEAERSRRPYIGTEHLLLGILVEADSGAAHVLANTKLGVT